MIASNLSESRGNSLPGVNGRCTLFTLKSDAPLATCNGQTALTRRPIGAIEMADAIIATFPPARKPSDACSVYLMECDAPTADVDLSVCKVGISHAPQSRLATIRTATPFRVDIRTMWVLPSRDAAVNVEHEFHKQNANCRMRGEWFCGYAVGFAVELDYIVLDYLVEKMGMSLKEAALVFVGSGQSEDAASDIIGSQYGVSP